MSTRTALNTRKAALWVIAPVVALVILVSSGGWSKNPEIKLGGSCVTGECHGDVTKDRYLHGPVNLTQCSPCHTPIGGKHEFKAPATGRDLCVICHSVDKPMPVVHQPFQSDCTACHNPHGGENRHFIKGGEGAGSCNLCHDDVTKDATHSHGPVAVGECLACHTPHQSEHPKLLVDSPAQLCLGCHVDVGVAMKDAIAVHEPAMGDCSGCHLPHGGKNEFFLTAGGTDLCYQCHGDFIEKSKTAQFAHAPMTDGKSCRQCHSPHASNQTGLLSTDTSTLCLTCHNQPIEGVNGSIDNVAAQLKKGTFLHGPLRDKNCVACHQAHGSDHASILKREYPREFYAPYKEDAYGLCFECHDKTIALVAESEVTGFRDGTRNLHFLHVNKEKGRTCRACHAEHASQQPHHVRSEVPYGRWMMDVKYTKNDTGGTCETGCHIPYVYDRVIAVNEPGAK